MSTARPTAGSARVRWPADSDHRGAGGHRHLNRGSEYGGRSRPDRGDDRIGRIFTSGAIPISPLWGIDWAAMRPAIAVPRPAQSTSPRPLRDTTSAPGSTRPASCGTAGSTPEPITATMTPAPLVRRQARSGARRSWAHGGVASTGSVARVEHCVANDGVGDATLDRTMALADGARCGDRNPGTEKGRRESRQ